MTRLTLDMESDEHMLIKSACATLGISMRQFLLEAAFEKLEELEDEKMAERAREILQRIQQGKEKTIPLSEMKKRLG